MQVIKKNGRMQKLNYSKLDKQLQFLIKNTDIDFEDFKQKLHLNLFDGITTSDIQKNIILTASNNISMDELDWDIVAGRAYMWQLLGDVYKLTGFNSSTDWYKHIEWLVDNDYYKSVIIDKLKEFNITEDHFTFDNRDNIDLDNNVDFNKFRSQVMIDDSKYLLKTQHGNIEYPHLTDIGNSAMVSDDAEEFDLNYVLLREQVLSLATPFKRNLRRKYGNLGSCYVGETYDSLPGLFKSYTDIAMISKYGGGVGWYFGKIRPSDTVGEHVVKSNDIAYWIKIVNDVIVAVDQNGTRKGAITIGLDWWHMNIDSFLELKSELKGDLRMKAFDIFPQIIFDAYFVDACLNDEYVYCFNQYDAMKYIDKDVTELVDEELYQYHLDIKKLIENGANIGHKKIHAMSLAKKVFWTWIEIGDLYITHKDNLNLANYLKYDPEGGITKCGNLCVESFSISKPATKWVEKGDHSNRVTTETNGFTHSCNLLSINVVKFIDKDDAYIEQVCYQAVKILDKSIDLSDYPVLEAERTAKALRNIGIGVLGEGDYLAYYEATYDSEKGIMLARKLAEKIAYYCYKASIRLARELSPYPLFKKENYDKIIGHDVEELNSKSIENGNNYDWVELREDILKYGIRNFYLLAYAPNTTTALSIGVLPSYLPAYSLLNYQTLNDMSVAVKPYFLKERLWWYKTKFNYNPIDIIKFTEEVQYYVDTGMSMEINLNPEVNNDIHSIVMAILNGFKNKKLKAVYYSMTIDDFKNKTSTDGCAICKN